MSSKLYSVIGSVWIITLIGSLLSLTTHQYRGRGYPSLELPLVGFNYTEQRPGVLEDIKDIPGVDPL